MPGFDGTGPRGMGPMTGGGRGFCNPNRTRAAWWPYGVYHWATHHWMGYGYPLGMVPTREQEINFLKDEAQALTKTLEEIDARINELS
jgi:hypothetical protein